MKVLGQLCCNVTMQLHHSLMIFALLSSVISFVSQVDAAVVGAVCKDSGGGCLRVEGGNHCIFIPLKTHTSFPRNEMSCLGISKEEKGLFIPPTQSPTSSKR